jgi:hypothetical protein
MTVRRQLVGVVMALAAVLGVLAGSAIYGALTGG